MKNIFTKLKNRLGYIPSSRDWQFISWSTKLLKLLFSVLGLIAFIYIMFAFANLSHRKESVHYRNVVGSLILILAIFLLLKSFFKFISMNTSISKIKRWSSNSYNIIDKTEIFTATLSIFLILFYFILLPLTIGHKELVFHGHGKMHLFKESWTPRNVLGLFVFLFIMFWVISILVMRFNQNKLWVSTYNWIHQAFTAITWLLAFVYLVL